MPAFPELEKLRQKDRELQASLGYRVESLSQKTNQMGIGEMAQSVKVLDACLLT